MLACSTAVAACWFAVLLAQVAAAQSPQLAYLSGHEGAVRDVAITTDGRLIVSAGVDGTLRVWDRASGELLRTRRAHDKPILQFAGSPDGAAVALATADGWV